MSKSSKKPKFWDLKGPRWGTDTEAAHKMRFVTGADLHRQARPCKSRATRAGHPPTLKLVEFCSLPRQIGSAPARGCRPSFGLDILGVGVASGLQIGSSTSSAEAAPPAHYSPPAPHHPRAELCLSLQIRSSPRNSNKRKSYHLLSDCDMPETLLFKNSI